MSDMDFEYVPPRRYKSQKKSSKKIFNAAEIFSPSAEQSPVKEDSQALNTTFQEFSSLDSEFSMEMDFDLDMFTESIFAEF